MTTLKFFACSLFVVLVIIGDYYAIKACDMSTGAKSLSGSSVSTKGGRNPSGGQQRPPPQPPKPTTARTTRPRPPPPPPPRQDRCGFFGETLPTIEGDFLYGNRSKTAPWTAFVYLNGATTAACTGTIIAPQWIITMQSCVGTVTADAIIVKAGSGRVEPPPPHPPPGPRPPGPGPHHPGDHSGEWTTPESTTTESTTPAETTTTAAPVALPDPPTSYSSGVLLVVNDPAYDAGTSMHDIVLLKVTTPMPFMEPFDIQPVCLPDNVTVCASLGTVPPTGTGYVGGWVPDATAPRGGYWAQRAVTSAIGTNPCEAISSPAALVGGRTAAITSRANSTMPVMALGLLPNGAAGTSFTSACCALNFITANVPLTPINPPPHH